MPGATGGSLKRVCELGDGEYHNLTIIVPNHECPIRESEQLLSYWVFLRPDKPKGGRPMT
jgi:hypothetical protein